MQYKYQEEEKGARAEHERRRPSTVRLIVIYSNVSTEIRHWISTRRPTERDESDDAHDTSSRVAEGDATMTTTGTNKT